jgi:hypothetical protein
MPSYFEFSNDHIKYYEFNYEEKQKTLLTVKKAQIKHIKQVSFCIVNRSVSTFWQERLFERAANIFSQILHSYSADKTFLFHGILLRVYIFSFAF